MPIYVRKAETIHGTTVDLMALKQFTLAVLLTASAVGALAQPGHFGQAGREILRGFFTQKTDYDPSSDRQQPVQQQGAQQMPQNQGWQSSGYGDQGSQNAQGGGDQGGQRRQDNNRMSPDDRRRLRQQIEQAGHEVYQRRH
ncbi:hypothetical protein SAMN06265795_10689 [Noviherbaspirillum humi]|uniref:Uncharacterized protein n=1 Tax=Noviherbaspirillum humi TaxID=1688639 RepID=A0A239H4F1_9BURK|nr:hypothetical protein SAMN06265795_10689 [Noviherbaspirillum humi]